MMPEQTVLAALDIRCKNMMPIHWGAFNLSLRSWKAPVERVTDAAAKHDLHVITPMIGRSFSPLDRTFNSAHWWRSL